jgi:hypothetical protein
MEKPVSSCASLALGRARPRLARDGRQSSNVDPVRARHETQQRLGPIPPGGTTNTSDLTIWPSSTPRGGRGIGRGVGRFGELRDLDGDALAGGRVDDALDRGRAWPSSGTAGV